MYRFKLRIAAVSLLLTILVALPAMAQVIPAGKDRWVTPGDGRTVFEFPAGDVESLCGAPVSFSWDRTVRLVGVPEPGEDWDTAVARLNDADLTNGFDIVPIQVSRLEFRSLGTQETPCGEIDWRVSALDNQPVTEMEIFQTSDRGGRFRALIAVRVLFVAYDASGTPFGRLFYTMELPDDTGVPWSFGPGKKFRPGITEDDDCIEVLRKKLSTATGDHVYFIENLIAQGKCQREG